LILHEFGRDLDRVDSGPDHKRSADTDRAARTDARRCGDEQERHDGGRRNPGP
jgi:hypothetical protein